MKRAITSFFLGLFVMILIMILSISVAYLRLMFSGHGLHEAWGIIRSRPIIGLVKIASVPAAAIFLLSLVGSPRQQ